MIKVYTTTSQAIVCDERLKVFYYTSKDNASKIAKGIKCSVSFRETLAFPTEMLLSQGYEEIRM